MRARPSTIPLQAFWGLIALSLLAAVPAAAAPLNGRTVPIRQPDGSHVSVVVWGDEFYAVGETQDGYSVTRDLDNGFLCYALLSGDGRALVSTGVPANRTPPAGLARHIRIDQEAAHEQALAARADIQRRALEGTIGPGVRGSRGATTGAVQGITLIIDFSDDPGTVPPGTVSDYCNMPGYTGNGNNGSVYDYFYDVSEGLLKYTNSVPAQYYRAVHTKAYYCDNTISYGQRARELIVEALTAMEAAGFDFSLYDADNNGVIDALNCFYAGERWNAWGEGLWPHSWTVSFCADGVCTYRYQITNMGSGLTLGTFCHENGHMLMGWPDLYDYGYDSRGVGVFCLMAYGGFALNPAEPCAYMKRIAGWADVTVVTEAADDLVVPDDGNVVFKFDHPTLPNEYYLVENRQRVARDANLPDDGLAIWHVDTEGDNDNQQQTPELHYLVTLVQADGRWDLENNVNAGDGTDLYAAPAYTECSPETSPNTDWWDGSESGLSLNGIGVSGAAMTFDFLDAPPAGPAGLTAEGRELSIALAWGRVNASDLDHYLVERDTTALFGGGSSSVVTSDTTLVVYPLDSGTEYFFRVFAVDLGGNVSVPSGTASAAPTSDVVPSTPTGLAALGGGGVVELRWNGNPEVDVVAYAVVRDSTLAFAAPETLGFPTGSPYLDATCSLNRAYWYKVAAKDQGGALSGPSAPVAGIAVTGRAWYADASYGGFESGAYSQPYRSISTAVGHAVSGDVVIVHPGVYAEAVEIKDGVPLVGMRGAGSTTVIGAMTATGIGGSTVLKGLRLDGGGAVAIDLDCYLSDLVVEDCEFRGATTAGVSCHDGGSPIIRRNLFTGNARGIRCVDSGPLVMSNTFVANSSSDIANLGNPGPLVGGSLAAANDFLEPGTRTISNYDSVAVSAEYNYWGDDCIDPAWFSGPVDYLPWTDETHTLAFTECWSGVSDVGVPTAAYLRPGAPNPASQGTAIAFGFPEPQGLVTLCVYSSSGRLVRTVLDRPMAAGHHVAWWDGRDARGVAVASGVYLYRLVAGESTLFGKVAVLR
jgi:M6 family metalloprotease-like protein